MGDDKKLNLVLLEGESSTVEFKEQVSKLDRALVGMANAAGGHIYIGVNDEGKVVGQPVTNRLKSQIQDIARNCDPSIPIKLVTHKEGVLEVQVPEGLDKPYSCKEGFFIRTGSSTQKLNRGEIIHSITQAGNIRFDEGLNNQFQYPKDFSSSAFKHYLKLCNIQVQALQKDLLLSLNVAVEQGNQLSFTNAGVLFFSKEPQQFIQESYVTCVKYKTTDRYSIIDKKDFFGSPILQIEESLAFLRRHMSVEFTIPLTLLAARQEIYDYPLVALREAIINAVAHRDYLYDSSHIYIHLYSDRVEIQNPGGLYAGLTIEKLEKRSVRRNRLIADLLHRAGYMERVGSGFDRMRHALVDNNNPDMEVSATNFFNLRFYPRIKKPMPENLTSRQLQLYHIIEEKMRITKNEAGYLLHVSEDTALRELTVLMRNGLLKKEGTGKSTVYCKIGN